MLLLLRLGGVVPAADEEDWCCAIGGLTSKWSKIVLLLRVVVLLS